MSINIIDNLKDKKIILYGAGKIGRKILGCLADSRKSVEFFWDINYGKIEKFSETPVLEPDFDFTDRSKRSEYVVIITVFAENVSRLIAGQLKVKGYNDIIYKRLDLASIISSNCRRMYKDGTFKFDLKNCYTCPLITDAERCSIFEKYISDKTADDYLFNKGSKLVLPKIGVLVSNRCNLTCRGCNHLRDLYGPGDTVQFKAENITGDIEKLTACTDMIYQVAVVGGEAFLHPQLYEILEKIIQLPRIGIIQLITNGTVIPKNKKIFELIADSRTVVEISGYGDRIPERLRNNVSVFISELEKHKVSYFYSGNLQWFDFGGFEKRNYNRRRHHFVFTSCCFVSNDIFDGKLHKCSRSVFAAHIKKIPDYKEDYVDIRAHSPAQLRQKIRDFLKNEYPNVCLHCNGTSSKTITAAVQS